MSETIKYSNAVPVPHVINQLRKDLLDAGYSFGALFVANIETGNLGIFMPDGMPQATRMAMLDDLPDCRRRGQKGLHCMSMARMRIVKQGPKGAQMLVLMDMDVLTLSVMLCAADGKMVRPPYTVELLISDAVIFSDEVTDDTELDLSL
jgi:hypothetical protein